MIKRAAFVLMGLTLILILTGCESTGERVDRTGSQIEDRTDEEIDAGVDRALDDAFRR